MPAIRRHEIGVNGRAQAAALPVELKLADRLAHVVQRQVSGRFLEGLRDLRRPALRQLLERAHVEIPVVEKALEPRHEPRQEAPILTDAVAAHGRSPGLGPGFEKLQGRALRRGGVDIAREDSGGQTRIAVLPPVPIIHRVERRLALTYGQHRPFREHVEVFVGYDRGDLDDEIGFRLQAGHFEVDPNEIFWRFHVFQVSYERAALR